MNRVLYVAIQSRRSDEAKTTLFTCLGLVSVDYYLHKCNNPPVQPKQLKTNLSVSKCVFIHFKLQKRAFERVRTHFFINLKIWNWFLQRLPIRWYSTAHMKPNTRSERVLNTFQLCSRFVLIAVNCELASELRISL